MANKNNNKVIFSKYRPYYKSIFQIGLPIVIGQLGMVFVGIVDNIMVGHFSTEDLAAASFVNSVFNISIFVGLGFSYGLTPLVGKESGRKNLFGITRLLKNSILMNFLVGLLLSIVMGVIWLNIDVMGQPEELLRLISPYFILQMVSLPFLMMFNSFKQFSEGIKDTKTPMYIMLVSNVLNILGNSILIYGIGDIPPLGIVGAGISTLVSRIFILFAFVYLFFFSSRYRDYKVNFSKANINIPDIIKLNKMGWFLGMQLGMETAMFSITGIMVGWLGTLSLASHQVLASISGLGFMVYYGIGSAVSVLVSHFYGVVDFVKVRRVTIAGFHIVMLLCIVFVLCLMLTRNYIGYLFSDDIEIVRMVASLIIFMMLYQFGDGLQIIYANALRGLGDVSAMAIISFIGYFIIAIPVSYICGFVLDWRLEGIWVGYSVGLTIAGVLLWLRFLFIAKKNTYSNRRKISAEILKYNSIMALDKINVDDI